MSDDGNGMQLSNAVWRASIYSCSPTSRYSWRRLLFNRIVDDVWSAIVLTADDIVSMVSFANMFLSLIGNIVQANATNIPLAI
jgi:hypothetical protein